MSLKHFCSCSSRELLGEKKYKASRCRDIVHSFHHTGSSGVQLAVPDDVFICAEGPQHDCDILGVWAAGNRVRLCVSLRLAQLGMF